MFVAKALLSNKIFARNAVAVSLNPEMEPVFKALILLLKLTVSLPNLLVNIAEVSEIFNFVANKLAVAAVLAYGLNIAAVSAILTLVLIFVANALLSNKIFALNAEAVSLNPEVEPVFKALILLLKLTVSLPNLLVNMAAVSEIFNFVARDAFIAFVLA